MVEEIGMSMGWFRVVRLVGVNKGVKVVEGRHSKWNKHHGGRWYKFEKRCDRRRRFGCLLRCTSLAFTILHVCIADFGLGILIQCYGLFH